MSGQFKSFVSEEEVQEQRQRRQAEWEKVRKPDDPIECPEEETRSLFEQLQANKDLKDRELEEETRIRSSVKGLDDDEAQFLNFVSNRQIQIEKDRKREEDSVMNELKSATVLKVHDRTAEKASTSDAAKASSASAAATSKNTQKQLLSGAIKRKSTESKVETEEKKQKTDDDETGSSEERPDAKLMAGIPKTNGTTMVVAGILPGIADYEDSDSSTENESNSSDSEADHKIMPNAATQRVIQQMMQKLKEEGCG